MIHCLLMLIFSTLPGGSSVASLHEVTPPTRYARVIPRPEARGAVLRKLPLQVHFK